MHEVSTAGAEMAQRDQDLDVLTRAETALDVGLPSASVFAYLTDFVRQVEWSPTWLSVEPRDAGPIQLGSRFVIAGQQDLRWDRKPLSSNVAGPGSDFSATAEIIALEPSHVLGWRMELVSGAFLPGTSMECGFVLDAVTDDITTVRLRQRLLGSTEQLTTWMSALQGAGYPLDVLQRQADRALHNIRAILEGRV